MTGEVAALLAALSFGASLVLARRFMVAVAPESGVLVSIAANVTIFSVLALAAAWRGLLPPIDTRSIGLFAFGGIFGTLVGRNLTYQSIGRLGAARATSIRLSNSVFTLLLGYLVLQELPRPWQLVGLMLVTLGLFNTLGLLMLYVGLSRAPVAIVSVLYNLQTLVVLILSPMALRGQETLTTWLVFGTLTALMGTALILLG